MPNDLQLFKGLTPQEIATQFSREQMQEALSAGTQPTTQIMSKLAGVPPPSEGVPNSGNKFGYTYKDSGSRKGSGLDRSYQGARARGLHELAVQERTASRKDRELDRQIAADKATAEYRTQTLTAKNAPEVEKPRTTTERNALVRGILNDALSQVKTASSAESGITALQANLSIGDEVLTESEAKTFVSAILSAAPGKDPSLGLTASQQDKLAGLISVDSQLARVEKKISTGRFDDVLGTFDGGITGFQNAMAQETLRPDVRALLVEIGFAAETAVRLFSGAAVRTEEEERFRSGFIGSLAGGRDNMLASMNAFQGGLRNQRDQVLKIAKANQSGDTGTLITENEVSDYMAIAAVEGPGQEAAMQWLVDNGYIP